MGRMIGRWARQGGGAITPLWQSVSCQEIAQHAGQTLVKWLKFPGAAHTLSAIPFARASPTETHVERGTSQRKRGTSVDLSKSGNWLLSGNGPVPRTLSKRASLPGSGAHPFHQTDFCQEVALIPGKGSSERAAMLGDGAYPLRHAGSGPGTPCPRPPSASGLRVKDTDG